MADNGRAMGKSIDVPCMSTHRVSGDRTAEAWVVFDMMSMLQQIGAMPSQG